MKIAGTEITAISRGGGEMLSVIHAGDMVTYHDSILDALSAACDSVPENTADASVIVINKAAANLIAKTINERSPMDKAYRKDHRTLGVGDFGGHMISPAQSDGSFNYTVTPPQELTSAIDDVDEWIHNYCKTRNIPKIGHVDKDGKVTPR